MNNINSTAVHRCMNTSVINPEFEIKTLISGPLTQILCDNSPEFASKLESFRTATKGDITNYEIGGKKVELELDIEDDDYIRREYRVEVVMDEKRDLVLLADYQNGNVRECAFFKSEKSCDVRALYQKALTLHGKPMGDLLGSDGIFTSLRTQVIANIRYSPAQNAQDVDMVTVLWVDYVDLDEDN